MNLVIVECKTKLLNARLNCVPPGQTMSIWHITQVKRYTISEIMLYWPNWNVTRQTKVFWLENLICARVIQNGFRVDASLVCKRAITAAILWNLAHDLVPRITWSIRDGIHEGNIDLDRLSDQVLNFTKHGQIVFGLYVFWICSVEARDKASKRSDADSFANTKDSWSGKSTMRSIVDRIEAYRCRCESHLPPERCMRLQ